MSGGGEPPGLTTKYAPQWVQKSSESSSVTLPQDGHLFMNIVSTKHDDKASGFCIEHILTSYHGSRTVV